MTKSVLLILLFPMAMGCTNIGNNDEANVQLIQNYVQAVENMDYDSMSSFLADDYLGLGPSHGDSISKADAVESWKFNVENIYESIKYNKSRIVPVTITTGDNQGEWVSNWAELDITYKNTPQQVTIWANSIYKIENGKIAESITFYNEADALRQLGFLLIEPSDY